MEGLNPHPDSSSERLGVRLQGTKAPVRSCSSPPVLDNSSWGRARTANLVRLYKAEPGPMLQETGFSSIKGISMNNLEASQIWR